MPQFSIEGRAQENSAARLYAGSAGRSADAVGIETAVGAAETADLPPTLRSGEICDFLFRSNSTLKAQNWMGLVRLFQSLDFTLIQADFQRRERLIEMRHLAGTDDGRTYSRFGQYPGEGHLRILNSALCRDFAKPVHNGEVRGTIVKLLREVVGFRAYRFSAAFTIPVSGKKSTRQRAPGNQPHTLLQTKRNHLPLFFPVDQVVVILHGHKPGQSHQVGGLEHLEKLPCIHGRWADVECLSRTHDLVQSLERFFDRSVRIKTVDLVKIDIVGLQTPQAVVYGVHDVLARETLLIRIASHGVEDLGGNDQFVPRWAIFLERASGNLLADAQRIDIRSVKKVDAGFDRAAVERSRLCVLQHPLTPLF